MNSWRSSLSLLWRTPLARVAMALGAGAVAIGGYAGVAYVGGHVPFAAAMNLPTTLAMLPDPLSIMAARSPGERGAGAMFNTKPPRQRQLAKVPPPRGPRERVLTSVRDRAPVGWVPVGDLPDPQLGFVPDVGQPITPLALGPQPPAGFNPPPIFPTGPNLEQPPPVFPGPVPTPTPTPELPTPAVPEPATWGMMLLGFALTGAAVRRGARSRKRAPTA